MKIQGLIEGYLVNIPELRDNDRRLIANVWNTWLKLHKKTDLTVLDFLKLFAKGDIPHPESIRRQRQKLQEINPTLRGKNWDKRHKDAETIATNINRDNSIIEKLFDDEVNV